MTLDRSPADETPTAPWRLGPLVVVALLAAVLALWQLGSSPTTAPPPWTAPAGESTDTVELVIETAPGERRIFENLSWQPGMTVLHVLQQAEREPGGLRFTTQGEGELVLVVEIDGFRNQGSGAEAKNWLFFQNGAAGTASCAVQVVKPGDTILWKFTGIE